MEIQILKDELEKVTLQLEETQLRLEEEEVRADKAIAEMRVELESSQVELRKQHDEKDKQIKDIIARWVLAGRVDSCCSDKLYIVADSTPCTGVGYLDKQLKCISLNKLVSCE